MNDKVSQEVRKTNEHNDGYYLEDVLTLIGFGKVHLEILFASAIIVLAIVNETIGSSIVVLASQCDFDTNSQEKALMTTCIFIGLLISAYPLGHLADIYGRQVVLLNTTVGATIFSFLGMLAWNKWAYMFCQFLTGLSIGGSTSTVYPFLSEFIPMKYRPAVINYATLPLGLSLIFSAALSCN